MRPRRVLLKTLSPALSRYASQPHVVIYASKFAYADIDHRFYLISGLSILFCVCISTDTKLYTISTTCGVMEENRSCLFVSKDSNLSRLFGVQCVKK